MNTYTPDRAPEQDAPLLDCPSCGLPAAITDHFTLGGAPSPVEKVGKGRIYRHEVRRAAVGVVLDAIDRLVLVGAAPSPRTHAGARSLPAADRPGGPARSTGSSIAPSVSCGKHTPETVTPASPPFGETRGSGGGSRAPLSSFRFRHPDVVRPCDRIGDGALAGVVHSGDAGRPSSPPGSGVRRSLVPVSLPRVEMVAARTTEWTASTQVRDPHGA